MSITKLNWRKALIIDTAEIVDCRCSRRSPHVVLRMDLLHPEKKCPEHSEPMYFGHYDATQYLN